MKKKVSEYINEYITAYIKKDVNKFINVKIYVPKKNGKPCLDKNCRWYVYFYYTTSSGEKKLFKIYHGINRIKGVRKRMQYANLIKEAVESFLRDGGDPFARFEKQMNTLEALKYAFDEKSKVWGDHTYRTNKIYYDRFILWLKKNNLDKLSIDRLRRRHITVFLNDLNNDKKTAVYINNHRKLLSALFGKLAQDDIIVHNIVSDIPRLKETPQKNKAFTHKQLKEISEWLQKNDLNLYRYIKFLTYTFLRPVEINRIKIGDIDLQARKIFIQTKTEKLSIVPVIDKAYQLLSEEIKIHLYKPDDFLFTSKGVPGKWSRRDGERGRYSFFKRRFQILKKELGLGNEYGMYSFRHTFALELYNKFIKEGMTDLQAKHKLMTITRHQSLSSLEKYLRGIGAYLPNDYSDYYGDEF